MPCPLFTSHQPWVYFRAHHAPHISQGTNLAACKHTSPPACHSEKVKASFSHNIMQQFPLSHPHLQQLFHTLISVTCANPPVQIKRPGLIHLVVCRFWQCAVAGDNWGRMYGADRSGVYTLADGDWLRVAHWLKDQVTQWPAYTMKWCFVGLDSHLSLSHIYMHVFYHFYVSYVFLGFETFEN